MELDTNKISIIDILAQYKEIFVLKQKLIEQGWKETNFGFHLGRKTGALDIQRGNERILIFDSPPIDQINYQLLQQANLPHFIVRYFYNNNTKIGIADLPFQARVLDSFRYPEKQQTTGYLGAYEVLGATAILLGQIALKTSTTLPILKLENLSLIAGENDIIKLVPPIELKDFSSENQMIDILSEQLLEDLKNQDPQNDHQGQVKYFKYKLQRSLKR